MASRSQTNLFTILIIIVGFVGGYLYYSQFASDAVVIETGAVDRDDLNEFDALNLNFAALDNETFSIFVQIGEAPVDPGVVGNINIFGELP